MFQMHLPRHPAIALCQSCEICIVANKYGYTKRLLYFLADVEVAPGQCGRRNQDAGIGIYRAWQRETDTPHLALIGWQHTADRIDQASEHNVMQVFGVEFL